MKKMKCESGHDYACWRGAIVPALERIIDAHQRNIERSEQDREEDLRQAA